MLNHTLIEEFEFSFMVPSVHAGLYNMINNTSNEDFEFGFMATCLFACLI